MRTQAVRAGLLAIVVTLFAVAPAMAQEGPGTPATEGIQVHGHWIIEVYEGDRLVERREFENALAEGGAVQMLEVLASSETPGVWLIGLQADYEFDGTTIGCSFFDLHHNGSCYEQTEGAQTTIPTSGDNAGKLVLQRSFVQSSEQGTTSWTILAVASGMDSCANSTAPVDCTSNINTVAVTEKTLATPVSVEQGQQVNITVIISFTG